MTKLEEIFAGTPDTLSSMVQMTRPNEIIPIYQGQFKLLAKDMLIILNGKIEFRWSPHKGTYFIGTPNNYAIGPPLFSLLIDDHEVGKALTKSQGQTLDGVLQLEAIFGNPKATVVKVKFSLLNVRDFHGDNVKKVGNGIRCSHARLIFAAEKFTIVLDKVFDYDKLEKELDEAGGYFPLYNGELTPNKGKLERKETNEILECFSVFMSFLNGKRTSAFFRFGFNDDKVVWSDFTSYHVETHKLVWSWPRRFDITGLDTIWKTFHLLWNESSDNRHALKTAIHWYNESNNYAGFAEGSIILTQTGLELMFNWLLVDRKGMFRDKNPDGFSAAKKIRLLLKELKLSPEVPKTLTYLKAYLKQNPDLGDGPNAITSVRNSMVHGKQANREKSAKIKPGVVKDAYDLGLLYLELSLLYALNYQHGFMDRCQKFTERREHLVPWAKTSL